LKTSDFHYNLPDNLIAQNPANKRDYSKMLVINRDENRFMHDNFINIVKYLNANDLIVLNNTKVIKARVYGKKANTGGKVELLFLHELKPGVWKAMLKSSRRPGPGDELLLGQSNPALFGFVKDVDLGSCEINIPEGLDLLDFLEREGELPLPPYIQREEGGVSVEDTQRYQTVFAKNPGAVAAPTAGLHFNEKIFSALEDKGVRTTELTLHVGMGTFQPVKVDDVEAHDMHEEYYDLSQEAVDAILETKANGGRIVCIGTTTVRTLESVAATHGKLKACSGSSRLFIYPPYEFKVVDVLLTNFHLPCSTLLMLVSAFASKELIENAYQEAIKEKYRFYSYGDCMLVI